METRGCSQTRFAFDAHREHCWVRDMEQATWLL
jgi:hypothetical protein